MKAAGLFISTLLLIDTFFVSYAVGFNSRHVLVVDPSLPPVQQTPVTNESTDNKKSKSSHSDTRKLDGGQPNEPTHKRGKHKSDSADRSTGAHAKHSSGGDHKGQTDGDQKRETGSHKKKTSK